MCRIFNAKLYNNTPWKDSDGFVNGSNECEVQMKSDMFGALSEMFFLSKCHIRGVVLDSDKLIFTWQNDFYFFWEGGVVFTLQPSQIQANTVMS